jgi:primosomal protein N'
MTPLQKILAAYRATSQTEREKGTYFEELIRTYFRFEASYADLYSDVWLFADWAKAHGFSAKDTGIDLVAKPTAPGNSTPSSANATPRTTASGKPTSTASSPPPAKRRSPSASSSPPPTTGVRERRGLPHRPALRRSTRSTSRTSKTPRSTGRNTSPPPLPPSRPRKQLRKHQGSAKTNVLLGLKSADRGKLIMACGTGKTFTSLKIAENVAGPGKRVLFLVPSLNLLSQTLTEWTQESAIPLQLRRLLGQRRRQEAQGKDEDIVRPSPTNCATPPPPRPSASPWK